MDEWGKEKPATEGGLDCFGDREGSAIIPKGKVPNQKTAARERP